MTRRAGSPTVVIVACACGAWLCVAAGVIAALIVGDRAVTGAAMHLLEAETATAARALRAPGGAAILDRVLGDRWRVHDQVLPGVDEARIHVDSVVNGVAAVYDADGWDAVGHVTVMADRSSPRLPRRRLAMGTAVALMGLVPLAWVMMRRTGVAAADGRVRRYVAAWVVPAALVALPIVVAAARAADHALAQLTARRLAIATQVLDGRTDLPSLARIPSGVLDRTGLRFVPGPGFDATDDLWQASGLPVETARALARTAGGASRVQVDAVEWAVADVGPIRLVFLPYEHTHAPGTAMMAIVLVGLVASIPCVGIASLARDARRRRRERAAWSFLAPALLHLLVFTFGPLLFAAWLSLHRWSLIDPARPFVGLANYVAALQNDGFRGALANTAFFTLHVPVSMAIALGLALLVRVPGRWSTTARAVFFLPGITSLVAVAIVWQWILHDEYGLVNAALAAVGLPRVRWLSSPDVALMAVMIVATWTSIGFQTVLFQAGLTAIPRELYEAARIDGASRWQQFVHVTLPGLRPTLFFVLVTSIIPSFQAFGTVYVMTEGGPLHATDVAVFHIYEEAWELQRVGSAAAMSWLLFLLIFVVTWLHFRTLERRAGGGLTA